LQQKRIENWRNNVYKTCASNQTREISRNASKKMQSKLHFRVTGVPGFSVGDRRWSH